MREKSAYLLKNMLYFGFGSVIPKLLSMLIVPLYTACLSPAEYGTADLILSTSSLFLALLTLNISEATLRCTLDRSLPKEQILAASLHIIFVSAVLLGLVLLIFPNFVPNMDQNLLFLFYLTYLTLAVNSIISAYCRGTDRVAMLMRSQILNSVITLGSSLLFLLYLHLGLHGYLLAAVLGSISASLYCVFRCRLQHEVDFHYPPAVPCEMLRYSAPLVFSTAAWWLGSVQDRWLLNWYHGAAAVGLYAIAFKIPSVFTAVQSIFSQAWRLSAIKDFDPSDRDGFVDKAYQSMNFCLLLLCSALLLFQLPLAHLLYSKEFFDAWKYTPFLLLALLFSSFSLFLEDLLRALKYSRSISLTLCVGTGINLLTNLLLIPHFGIYAAAFSLLFSSAATYLLRRFLLRKLLRLPVHRKNILACALLILQSGFACLGENVWILQLLSFFGLLLMYQRDFMKLLPTKKTH